MMSDKIQNPCRNCETNLSQEYLRELEGSPNVWFACPNQDCNHVHARVAASFDQMPREVALATGRKLHTN